jgi:phospholipid transport system substrate-binding protein
MTVSSRTVRSIILSGIVAALAFPGFADANTEAYVLKNANEALKTLNNPKLTAAERTATFGAYMEKFADLNAVANYAIGKYNRRFTAEELALYQKAFKVYALAVYENQLDAYRGEAIVVKSSVDRSKTDSIVKTVIKRKDGKEVDVRWRVLTRDSAYHVVDVGLNTDGNLIWLGIEQRAQFIALLDKTNGSAPALIQKIEEMTEKLAKKKRK